MVDIFFHISPQTEKTKIKIYSLNRFFNKRVVYFLNELSLNIKNGNCNIHVKIKFDSFETNVRKTI